MARKLTPAQRKRKTEWQRAKRAEAALAAGREPHRTGRPSTGGRKSRAQAPVVIPDLHTGHELFDQARKLSGIESNERSKTLLRRDDLIRQDALSEAVLAILEGRDAEQAAKACRSRELTWVYKTTRLVGFD